MVNGIMLPSGTWSLNPILYYWRGSGRKVRDLDERTVASGALCPPSAMEVAVGCSKMLVFKDENV